MQPSIAVGITAFNCHNTLRRAVASAIAANVTEIVICDDGSSDGTIEVIRELSSSNTSIVPLFHATNAGVAAARNSILAACKSELLMFLDDDDEMTVQRRNAQLNQFVAVSASVGHRRVLCYGGRETRRTLGVREFSRGLGASSIVPPSDAALFVLTGIKRPGLAAGLYGTGTLLAGVREMLAIGGFDESFRRCEDAELLIRAAEAGFVVTSCAESVIVQHITPGPEKASHVEYKMRNRIVRKHIGVLLRTWPLLPAAAYLYSLKRSIQPTHPQLARLLGFLSICCWSPRDILSELHRRQAKRRDQP